jgi:hypothetical protein
MADKNVQMPDGTVVAFPASMSDDAIANVLKAQHPAAKAPGTRNDIQKSFDANTQINPNDTLLQKGLKSVVGSIGSPFVHPLDTAAGLIPKDFATQYSEAQAQPKQSLASGLVTGLGQGFGALALGEAAGAGVRAAPVVARGAADVPDAYRNARANIIGGSKLDEVIPGDTVTPRQRYNAAKDMGVNLDTAQATNAPVPKGAKWTTEHSLGGSSKFEANQAANTNALQVQAQKILDQAHPDPMSREEFGNSVKDALLDHKGQLEGQAGLPDKANAILDSATPDSMSREEFGTGVQTALRNHQQLLNDKASTIFQDLDGKVGGTMPDMGAVRAQAHNIVQENQNYYKNHPELLSGAPGRAWSIVKSLADTSAEEPKYDTWSDLHKMRSDLMNMYRSPDIVGSNAEGWLKQLTGKVDQSMTGAASGLSAADEAQFRKANDIYSGMKQTYDNPQSPLYHIVRAQDGTVAANSLSKVSPQVAKQIRQASSDLGIPELNQQLQRQTIDKLMDPTGNGSPDIQGLPDRLAKAQKEQLGGVLSPRHISDLEDLSRQIQTPGPYDNPRSDVHKIINAKDGVAAATSAMDAGPEGIAQISKAAQSIGNKDVVPQLQRQTMSRLINPAGNDLPDLKNLPSRFTRAQKEKLNFVLTPQQMNQMESLGRTAQVSNYDVNPAGSGKLVQKSSERTAAFLGGIEATAGMLTGNPMAVAKGMAPAAWIPAARGIASKLNNSAFTDSIMNPPLKGQAKWAALGEAKLTDHLARDSASTLTAADVQALSKTPKGKNLMIQASDLNPGSAAMKALVKSIKP